MNDVVVHHGRVIAPDGVKADGWVSVAGGRIAGVGSGPPPPAKMSIDLAGRFLAPGFLDLHVHVAADLPFVDADAPGRRHLAAGTTACLLTTSRGPLERMVDEMQTEWDLLRDTPFGRTVVGLHLEGPFVNSKAPGAIPPMRIEPPDARRLEWALDALPLPVRLMTLAPELEGNGAVIDLLVARGIAVALGHTLVDYEGARRAADRGVTATCHTYNAMGTFHHRAPGAIGAALTDDRLNAEVIADGVHVHPAAVDLLVRARGVDGIRLGTDSTLADRLKIPGYRLDGLVYRDQQGRIAGGRLALNRAVANLARFARLDVPTAVRAATVNPARLIGLYPRKGVLAPGADADLVVFDDHVAVSLVLVGGEIIRQDSPLP